MKSQNTHTTSMVVSSKPNNRYGSSKHNNNNPSRHPASPKFGSRSPIKRSNSAKFTNSNSSEKQEVVRSRRMQGRKPVDINKARAKLTAVMDEDDEIEEMMKVGATKDRAWQLEIEAVQKQHAIDVEALAVSSQELQRVRQQLVSALESKKVAVKEAEANSKRVRDLYVELQSLKELQSSQVSKRTSEGVEEAEKDANSLDGLKEELRVAKESESQIRRSFSESKTRVEKLEVELYKAKESETELSETLRSNTKQLEETNLLLLQAKSEISSLQKKIQSVEDEYSVEQRHSSSNINVSISQDEKDTMKGTIQTLKAELQIAKEEVARAQAGSSTVSCLSQEIIALKTELKLATDAEEKSRKAMDDLALVLIEVKTESTDAQDKLRLAQSNLSNVKEEVQYWKQLAKTAEERYQPQLEEARKEIERLKCTSDRLKVEAEDAILAWNGKELEFVNCIRRAEEEGSAVKQENHKLAESLKIAEDMAKVIREENCKLRDILKQAINEATVAKEAAGIAREENSQLKDCTVDKDDMIQNLTRENERLRINEAASFETIKELKRLLNTSSRPPTPDVTKKTEEDTNVEHVPKQDSQIKEHKDDRKLTEILHLKLEELKLPNGLHKDHKDEDFDDPELAELFKGSIFDVVDSPDGPKPVTHHRKMSSSFTEYGDALNMEEFDHEHEHEHDHDGNHLDESESEKSSQRKKKALYRRFGEILRRTSFHHRRETSVG